MKRDTGFLLMGLIIGLALAVLIIRRPAQSSLRSATFSATQVAGAPKPLQFVGFVLNNAPIVSAPSRASVGASEPSHLNQTSGIDPRTGFIIHQTQWIGFQERFVGFVTNKARIVPSPFPISVEAFSAQLPPQNASRCMLEISPNNFRLMNPGFIEA